MRVCLVAFQFWPSVGGSQAQTEKQARYLQQLGQEVLVVTLRHQKTWPTSEEYASFSVIRIGGFYERGGTLRVGRIGHLFVDLLLFLTLWRKRQSYDLIHALQISPLAAVAALVGKLIRKPVIVGVQSTGPSEYEADIACEETSQQADTSVLQRQASGGDLADLEQMAWGGRWMLNYLRESDVYYHILSSRSYVHLVQHGFRPERIVYIPNGVDIRQFYPAAWHIERSSVQERTLLCVGRLEYAKGIDVLLRAWAYMLNIPAHWRTNLQPRLLLAGDGSCRIELEKLALELGIQESVEFLGTRYDIAHLMRSAWGFVLPSRWEGMSNALLEAMACGLPCIATRVSGSEDVIEQGVNGLLVEPEQVEQMAYALRLLIDDTNLGKQLGWKGYETVLTYYQLSSTVQGSVAFYRYLLSRKNAVKRQPGYCEPTLNPYPEEWQRYE